MRSLATAIGVGWFWLAFYAVGPLTTGAQLAVAGGTLSTACGACAIAGAVLGRRRATKAKLNGPVSPL